MGVSPYWIPLATGISSFDIGALDYTGGKYMNTSNQYLFFNLVASPITGRFLFLHRRVFIYFPLLYYVFIIHDFSVYVNSFYTIFEYFYTILVYFYTVLVYNTLVE